MRIDDASSTPSTARARLGVIGLGSMGEPMAGHLLAAHGALVVHSRSRRESLIAAGATWAETPRELVEQVDAVLVMLPDLPQLTPMLEGPDSLLAAGTELLLMIGSTSSPRGVRELAARLHDESGGRVRVVDVPVSGGEAGATAGTLSIMAGGAEEDVRRAATLLAPCGTVRHLGPLGAGEVAKACNQMIVGATMMAIAEATVLAERSGIAPADLFEVLAGGYAGSTLLADKRDKLVAGDYSPGGIAAYMTKDLGFAADVAEDTGTSPALLGALRGAYDELVAAGLGKEDLSVARRFVAERGA
ncbi:NAD(P)-dependent oxidoreductase [Brachybacterium paraconglomeratum]|uniref:NAD(P)-dependent oxidoreductase n=1 Tax=Brachybacterium paraconglomeratum TaxID=173362 RepID=UPI00223AA76A|nr:NAD(P)-dependent oxidoreductase [Brachybacterium paraconglomeratum]MCT1436542.1 NAD(P)-dependent oxidoreductase [Brachybacterium paraconglomeratum]